MPDMDQDPVQRSLDRIDRGDVGGQMREGRKEFQQPGIARPDERPQDGQTMIQRAVSRFRTREPRRDMSR